MDSGGVEIAPGIWVYPKIARDHRPGQGDATMLVTGQALGAYPNGSRVEKCFDLPGDTHKVGDCGTVLSSIGPMPAEAVRDHPEMAGLYGYFVEWDDTPGVPVLITSNKVRYSNDHNL